MLQCTTVRNNDSAATESGQLNTPLPWNANTPLVRSTTNVRCNGSALAEKPADALQWAASSCTGMQHGLTRSPPLPVRASLALGRHALPPPSSRGSPSQRSWCTPPLATPVSTPSSAPAAYGAGARTGEYLNQASLQATTRLRRNAVCSSTMGGRGHRSSRSTPRTPAPGMCRRQAFSVIWACVQVRYSEVSSAAHGAASPATALQTGTRQGGSRDECVDAKDGRLPCGFHVMEDWALVARCVPCGLRSLLCNSSMLLPRLQAFRSAVALFSP
jgi:hypothetical protein